MHKMKNKKLMSIFMAGIISYACISTDKIYANNLKIDNNTSTYNDENDTEYEDNNSDLNNGNNDTNNDNNVENDDNLENDSTDNDNVGNDNNNTNIPESNPEINTFKEILVSEINSSNNIGLTVKVKGNITKIQDNKIYIKDQTGEGAVFLENIQDIKLVTGNTISVIGVITNVNNENLVLVNNIKDIEVVSNSDKPNNIPNINEDKNNNGTLKPNYSNMSQNISRPSNQTISLNTEAATINTIKSKDEIVIEDDLSDEQWEIVKTQLEEKNIKVKDIENNKIRIKKVNDELGDNVWIVNDPRMLDSEETKVLGKNIIDTLLYSEYDIDEDKWTSIVEDVESGIAKIKYDSEKNIKVIYQNTNKKDSITTISRL